MRRPALSSYDDFGELKTLNPEILKCQISIFEKGRMKFILDDY